MIKVVTFFLIGMLVLAMFGKLRLPYVGKVALQKPRKCPNCGKFLFNNDPCGCKPRRRKG